MDQRFIEIIRSYADVNQVRRDIVYGICARESAFDPFACRYEPNYRWLYSPSKVKPATCSLDTETMLQKTSWGLMQVMGGVFREYGFKGWLSSIPADPRIQLQYGCMHLATKIRKYGMEGGIAAYNAGIPDANRDGAIDNPAYVQAVLKFSKEYSE